MKNEYHPELIRLLSEQRLCVISTLQADGRPQGSTVAFSNTPDMLFVIGTDVQSRKSQNMLRDNRVALTITNADERFTAQIEGTARQLPAEEFEERFSERHYKKLPFSLPFKDIEGQVNYLITPTLIRFSDCNPKPWVVTEYRFDGGDI